MDIKSPEERSRNMSKIRSRDTRPEVYLRKKLFARGFRYRTNPSNIYGHPDIWLARYRTAIFMNGCFWHRHAGCRYAYMPKSRVEFWQEKFHRNVEQDEKVHATLRKQGIRCLVVWECTIRKMMRSKETEQAVLRQIEDFLHGSDPHLEL